MNPDVFISMAFVSLVVLLALIAALFAHSEYRRGKDADESSAEIAVISDGCGNGRRAQNAQFLRWDGQSLDRSRKYAVAAAAPIASRFYQRCYQTERNSLN